MIDLPREQHVAINFSDVTNRSPADKQPGYNVGRLASATVLGLVAAATLAVALTAAGAPATPAQPSPIASIWIEGEDADRTTFNRHGWYSGDGVRTDLFSPGVPGGSPGAWLAHYSNGGATAEAEFDFEVSLDDRYTLWMRASAYRVRMWYRLDGAAQVEIDMESDRRENVNLIAPGIDIRFLAWIKVGEFDLPAGPHNLTFGVGRHPLMGSADVHGGIDALALTNARWGPSGAVRPPDSEPGLGGADEWFPLIVPDDDAGTGSVTDASALLHRPAGVLGHVRRDGDQLVYGDGSVARFWGVNAHPPATEELMEAQASFLARNGINLVRLHPVTSVVGLLVRDPESGRRQLQPDLLGELDLWLSILKDRGIYFAFSPFYPHIITPDDGYDPARLAELPDASTWGLPAGMSGKSSSGVVNFVPELQAAEWEWLRELLVHENPYTGLRYVDDPALATIEVHNEDSVFWHAPLNGLQGGEMPLHLAYLQREWMLWLQARYDNDAALLSAWGPAGSGSRWDDSLSNPTMAIYGAWEMGADGPSLNRSEAARMGDFIRFLAERQRDYFTQRGQSLRDLGYQGVTISTAWMAGGDSAHLANLWTDAALDMIDRHQYFGGGDGGHSIGEGAVNSGSHLDQPGSGILGRGLEQYADHPFMLSEWNQNTPNQWKAEIAPLVAFYGFGLNGWDASTHFSADRAVRMGTGWPDERSYVTETPHYLGQFPVLARSVLRGDFAEGDVVAARRVHTDHIFSGIDARSQWTESGGWAGEGPGGTLDTPSETLAMGKVTFEIGPGLARSERSDWDAYWDRDAEVIRSVTDELLWNTAERVVEVSSPRTQGLVGFAGGGAYKTSDLEFQVSTDFVSLLVTSLDDRPIAESEHLVVTALARDRQTGARYSSDGSRLEEVGGPPLLLEPVQARLRIGWSEGDISFRPLDPLGVPVNIEVERDADGWFVLDGRYRAYAYEIRRSLDPTAPTAIPEPTADPTTTETTTQTTTPTTSQTPTPTPTVEGTPDPRSTVVSTEAPVAADITYLPLLETGR